ncbi:MAG: helix-turn-helix domain-containing protein [Oscillospiraceae bacterium]|nr:helix-turn-helix domain-containing protein [Oscillospiraceae bacterium]
MSLNFKLIGRRIKGARKLKQMSQAELAEQINMSVPYISHIETATKQTLQRLF